MKSNSFSKKLLSMILAILMTASCFTGAMSAFASESISGDTEDTLYDNNLVYNFLGWVEATDVQVLDALLDFADEMMAENLGAAKGTLDISVATLDYDMTSVNGALSTLNSARQLLKSTAIKLFLGGDAKKINLGGQLKNYVTTGGNGDVMTRQNSSSKDIIRGIVNILYMNSNSYANEKNNNGNVNDGGPVFQDFVNGSFNLGGLEGLIMSIVSSAAGINAGNSVYQLIGNLLGLPSGYQKNLVNNIVVYMLKTYVADDLTKDGVNNNINTSGTTYYFVGDNGEQLSIEQWAFDAINNGVLQTLIGLDENYMFKNEDGSANFELSVDDTGYDDLYKAFKPVFEHTLLPLLSTISVSHSFVTDFTKMYYDYVNKQNITAPSTQSELDSYWTESAINNWINADYEKIGLYIGGIKAANSTSDNLVFQYPDIAVRDEAGNVLSLADGVNAADVKAAMIELFNSLDRDETSIDATTLFSKVLYSPVAVALGCKTGVLNLNIKDYYLTKYNLVNFFDMSTLPDGGSLKDNVYGFLKELLSIFFPTFNDWAPASATQDVDGIVSEVVASAFKLIKFVGDSASAAIFAGYDELNESNLESAIMPLTKAILGQIDMVKQIHQDEWDKCDDIEGIFYVCLSEYLKYNLPQYDYTCLAKVDSEGHYDVTINDILPMARDAVAYVMQSLVPIKDKEGNEWDVMKKGGTKNGALVDANTTLFDMLNYVVCYYADDSGIAQLLNLTEYSVNGTASYASAITRNNTLWQNLDIVANKFFPILGDFFGVDSISSEDLIMNTVVYGLTNVSNTNSTSFGHGKQGISAILYNLVYAFTDSSVMQGKILNVAYNVIADLFNVVLGARDAKDGFGAALPANTGVQPFSDAIQNRILGGGKVNPSSACDYNNYTSEGLIGVILGRLAENSRSGILYTKSSRDVEDTILPGVAFILKAVNDLVGFIPQLSEHTFRTPTASPARSSINSYETDTEIEDQYIGVTNNAAGLNRAIFNDGSDSPTQISRYYIKVTDITCVNDENLTVDLGTRYENDNGSYVVDSSRELTTVTPATTAYYKVNGACSEIGSKQFYVTYDITDKDGNVIDPSYTGLKTVTSFYVTDDISWYDQLYTSSHTFNSAYLSTTANAVTKFAGTNVEATKVTNAFGKSKKLVVCYPANVILEGGSPETFSNIRMYLKNIAPSGLFQTKYERSMDTAYLFDGDSQNKAIPLFDDQGNVLDISKKDYYYPDANNGEGAWIVDNSSYNDLAYTDTRTHIVFTPAQVAEIGGAVTMENGTCKLVTIPYSKGVEAGVTWGTPIKGVYLDVPSTKLSNNEDSWISWLKVMDGVKSVDPGSYTFQIFFPNNDQAASGSINVTIVDTVDRNTTQSSYNALDKFQGSYMESDFDKLTAEDADILGLTTNDSYFDAIQSALTAANAAIAKPISISVVANNEKVATDRVKQVATASSTVAYGDVAYQQLTTVPASGMEYYALQQDEFGNASSTTYYYMDKEGKFPYYTNTAVEATKANFDSGNYVFVTTDGKVATSFDSKATYTVHVKNTQEYKSAWQFTYDTPYYGTTSELSGNYLAKQYKYADANGNASTSKKQWTYKYPDVITANVANDGTDYRSEYLKQSDLAKYVLEVAQKHVSSAGAKRIADEIIKDRKDLNENNFDKVSYNLMVKAAKAGEALISTSYDKEFIQMTESSDKYEVTGQYSFYVMNGSTVSPETDKLVATTTYPLFLAALARGDYAASGLNASSVAGKDYYFGYYDAVKDESGNIVYTYSTTSSGVAINEAIRMYNMYKAQVVNRGYKDNNLALLQEVLCATNDAYNYNYNIDALQTYVASAFTGTVSYEDNKLVAGSGTVTFSNASATPKYGVLENGVLKNDGYTEESWQNYVDALAEAVASVKNASTAIGYETGMYTPSAGSFDHQVSDINTLRTNLMIAENKLEKAAVSDGYTVSGYIAALDSKTATEGKYAVVGAEVKVGDITAVTDNDGKFVLEGLANGTYDAQVTYKYGFTRTFKIVVNGADINSNVKVGIVSCDFNGDGFITTNDYNMYMDNVGKTSTSSGFDIGYDLNRDNFVTTNDYNIYTEFVGATASSMAYTETVIK